MISVRSGVFETNSSSVHCTVVAPDELMTKFVNGELFADSAKYKAEGFEGKLVGADELYDICHDGVGEQVFNQEDQYRPVSKETVVWLMLHPAVMFGMHEQTFCIGLVHLFADARKSLEWEWQQEQFDRELDEMPEAVKDEIRDNGDTVSEFIDWISFGLDRPLSYAMMRYLTGEFSHGYDGYDSADIHEVVVNGKKMKKVTAVFYG
jgi:hypothetical protein